MRYRGKERAAGLIEALCREEEGIMRAERVLREVSRDYEKWAKSMTRLKGIMDYTSDMESAREKGHEEGHEEGHQEGHEEGYQEGHEDGHQEGHEEGYQEGHEEGREVGRKEGEVIGFIKTARNLKAKGFSLNDIAEATGLPLREIEEL
jgi:predicted transposase/invertase (TIGR01784 family)